MSIIERLARLIGMETSYWIGYEVPVNGGQLRGDCSITVKPYLTTRHMNEVREELQRLCGSKSTPNVTFVQRIRP